MLFGSKALKHYLLVAVAATSPMLCITFIASTDINTFALYNLGAILSLACIGILGLIECIRVFKIENGHRYSKPSLLAKVLALLSTLLFALTAVAVILLTGNLAGGIAIIALTATIACWTAAIFNDTKKTSEQDLTAEKKSQPRALIISNLLILGVSLVAQIMALVLFHQASLAYIFILSGLNLLLTMPVLFLTCRESTFQENSWPMAIISLVASGLFIAGAIICEMPSGFGTAAILSATFSSMITFALFVCALSQTYGTNEPDDATTQTSEPVPAEQHAPLLSNISLNSTDVLTSTSAPPQVTIPKGRPLEIDSRQSQSASKPTRINII